MFDTDFDEFDSLLDEAYAFQPKVLAPNAKALFFRMMAEYSLAEVRAAIAAHLQDTDVGQFAMQPAHVIAQIKKLEKCDGRPSVEEAWGIAVAARDEANTVVWFDELAQAFGVARPLLTGRGDETPARMAFKEAYDRIIAKARKERKELKWFASYGTDSTQREAAIEKAVIAGLLPAPQKNVFEAIGLSCNVPEMLVALKLPLKRTEMALEGENIKVGRHVPTTPNKSNGDAKGGEIEPS